LQLQIFFVLKNFIIFIFYLNNFFLSKKIILIFKELKNNYIFIYLIPTLGDWGLGIGDWGLGIGPNPQSPIPNPQSPIPKNIIIF
jgi:hypothetical protein